MPMSLMLEQQLSQTIQQALQQLWGLSIPSQELLLQPTHKQFEGSHTFVTFPWAKQCQQKPDVIAQQLGVWLLANSPLVADFNVFKGFLNITLEDQVWISQLEAVQQDPDFGKIRGKQKRVVIEFPSPNTNKPLHLGHLRNIFLGDAMAEIFKATGCEVHRVNLVNDRGIHICKSMVAYKHYSQGETPAAAQVKGDHLVGYYYVKFDQVYKEQVAQLTDRLGDVERAKKEAPILLEAQQMLQQWEQGDRAVHDLWRQMNGWVYEGFEATYKQLGIEFDKTYYESDTYLLGKQVVQEGLDRGIFYQREDGSVWIDLAEQNLDEKLLLRSDGTSVYITQDLGVADLRREDYAFDQSIYVVGNEQDYHFEVLFKVMYALGREYAASMYHLSYGMVDLPTGKMKSREGTVVDADELIERMIGNAAEHTQALGKVDGLTEEEAQQLYRMLGLGALKYFLLRVEAKRRVMFDPEASIDFQGHTGPFIQYTHARIAAILRNARQAGLAVDELTAGAELPLQPLERELIISMTKFPQRLQEAANTYSPAVIAQYAFDLAKVYNRLYAELPILREVTPAMKTRRLYLSAAVAHMLRRSMGLLGITLPTRM